MGKTKEEIEAGARVFGQAANTLSVVGEAVLKADNFAGNQMIAQNIIPAIVLKAFSCELFMKSLVVTGNIRKIHKLDELFNNLSQNYKCKIKDLVINTLINKLGAYMKTALMLI